MRLAKLRTITDEQEFIDHIDQIAFNQEELADLLAEDTTTIYLCGEKFTVPASRKGITYIGIGNPKVHISGRLPKTADKLEITFVKIQCDNLPRSTEAEATTTKKDSVRSDASLYESSSRCTGQLESDHYYLLSEEEFDDEAGDDVTVWYRYDKASNQSVRLPEEVQEALQDEDRDSYNCLLPGIGWDYLRYRDELCVRNKGDDICSLIDLKMNRVLFTQDDFDGHMVVAFNEDYIVSYSDEENGSVTILNRHKPHNERVLAVDTNTDDELALFLDDDQLNANVSEIKEDFLLLDKRLYFVVEHQQKRSNFLACFDLSKNHFHFIVEVGGYGIFSRMSSILSMSWTGLVGNGPNFIYMIRTTEILIVDLQKKSVHVVDNEDGEFEIAEHHGGNYIVYADDNPDHRKSSAAKGRGRKRSLIDAPNLFTIEMATGEIKEIPFQLDIEDHSMFYVCGDFLHCSNEPEDDDYDEDEEPEKRICYSFDLREKSPTPHEYRE